MPSASHLLLVEPVCTNSSPCLPGHSGTRSHQYSVPCPPRNTSFCFKQSPPFFLLRVSQETLVLLVTSPPLVPSVEHMPLIEPVFDCSSSPCLSGHSGFSGHKYSLSCHPRNTCFWFSHSPPALLLRVSRDTFELVTTGNPSRAIRGTLASGSISLGRFLFSVSLGTPLY